MKIKDIMSRNIISCNSNSTIYDVAKLMREYNIGIIPIIDEDLMGVITDRDIVIKCVYNNDPSIKSYISDNIISIEEDKEMESALKLMKEKKVKRLIVTKEKEIVGILSLSDIIKNSNSKEIINTIKSIYEIKDNMFNENSLVDSFYL